MHVDPMYARRTMYGHCVVHGIALLLSALDKAFDQPVKITELKTVFSGAVLIDDEVGFELSPYEDQYLKICLWVRTASVATITVKYQLVDDVDHCGLSNVRPMEGKPKQLAVEQIKNAAGSHSLMFERSDLSALFPNLLDKIPDWLIGTLLSLTRIVGMECPGLNSIFAEIKLEFIESEQFINMLRWDVKRIDPRWGLVTVKLEAPTINGNIKAFIRPEPASQPSILDIADKISDGQFSNRRALIIGGSRGVGEVCSKILAAGGADVKFSYHQGEAEAQKIVDEIVAKGFKAQAFQYDVIADLDKLIQKIGIGWHPTHIYYFATPAIFLGKKGEFQAPLFAKFCRYYVDGFVQLITQITSVNDDPVQVLYPSTVALDELPDGMLEYCAAKAAGETAASAMAKEKVNLFVDVVRLPRIDTDQTKSIHQVATVNVVEILIKSIG